MYKNQIRVNKNTQHESRYIELDRRKVGNSHTNTILNLIVYPFKVICKLKFIA